MDLHVQTLLSWMIHVHTNWGGGAFLSYTDASEIIRGQNLWEALNELVNVRLYMLVMLRNVRL